MTVTQDPTIESLADLLDRLGNVPPNRVRFRPVPGTATEADVVAAEAEPRKRLCELIDGVLVEKPMGYRESSLAGELLATLKPFVRAHNLGVVTGADGMVRLWPGRVRIPDVAFVSWGRLPERRYPTVPVPEVSPDLAVEILSEANTAAEMELKRRDYFQSGTVLVWEVDPELRTVTAYTAFEQSVTLRAGDTLEGGAVLPGFALPLADLFAELDRHG